MNTALRDGAAPLADVKGLDASIGTVYSDETHTIAAALAGQGVALMSRAR